MAMIPCPECGQEISDKSKKCVHCGKIFLEEIQPTRFCAECGEEISIDTQECPFCGYPVKTEEIESAAVTQKSTERAKRSKKPLVIIATIIIVVIIVGLVTNFIGPILNEDEQLAYQNAVEMKSMMKDPDSFRLYEEMFLLKHFDKNGKNDFTYTIFKYGGANGYGAITTDEAIFKDGKYIMNYADEPDESDANYVDQLWVKADLSGYVLFGDNNTLKKQDIDIAKIKKKMGLK